MIEEMNVRLFDEQGQDVTSKGRGQPGCKGPLLSAGYFGDEEAQRALYTQEGWMLVGDIVEIGEDGYLRVIGRADDFIIRGGKNISGPGCRASGFNPSRYRTRRSGPPCRTPSMGRRSASSLNSTPASPSLLSNSSSISRRPVPRSKPFLSVSSCTDLCPDPPVARWRNKVFATRSADSLNRKRRSCLDPNSQGMAVHSGLQARNFILHGGRSAWFGIFSYGSWQKEPIPKP